MKYTVDYTSGFKKQHKKMLKQGNDLSKLYNVIEKIANGEELDAKYQNHRLTITKCIEIVKNAILLLIGY